MTTYAAETVSGVVTSWLPVTTGFSAPSACFSAIYSQQGGAGQLIAFDPFYQSIVPSFTTACFPDQATAWYNQGPDPLSTVTSLGPFECPGGYSTAFTTADSSSTEIACCPSGYDYQGSLVDHGTVGECWSTPKVGATLRYYTLTDAGPWSETSTVLGSTHVVGVQINGWNIASTTSSSSSSSSTSSSGSSSSTSSSLPATSAAPGASSSSTSAATGLPLSNAGTPSSGGMSSGSKAAIGVGVALAVLGIAALAAAFILFRRTRQMQNPGVPIAPADGSSYWGGRIHDPKEIDGTPRRPGFTAQGGQYYEMSDNTNYRPT